MFEEKSLQLLRLLVAGGLKAVSRLPVADPQRKLETIVGQQDSGIVTCSFAGLQQTGFKR